MRNYTIQGPPRPPGSVSPWVEIAAWLLAFTILLFAPCAPEHRAREGARSRGTDQTVVAGHPRP